MTARTDAERESFMERAAAATGGGRRGRATEAPPGTLYRSADVTNDSGVRDARNAGFVNDNICMIMMTICSL